MRLDANGGSSSYSGKQLLFAGIIAAGIGLGVRSYAGLVKKVNNLSERLDGQVVQYNKMSVDDKITSENKGMLNSLNSTVKIMYIRKKDEKLDVLAEAGAILHSKLNSSGLFDNYVLLVAHTFKWDDISSVTHIADHLLWLNVYTSLELKQTYDARVVAFDIARDLAVLKFESKEKLPTVKLMDSDEFKKLDVLTPVYTIGCPIDKPPVKTEGELHGKNITSTGKELWLITALATFGNSGGGVFVNKTHDLLGVLTQTSILYVGIPEAGVIVESPVPHLNLITPAHIIREWFDQENFDFLYK